MFHYRVFWVGWWGLAVSGCFNLLHAFQFWPSDPSTCFKRYTNGFKLFQGCLQGRFPRPSSQKRNESRWKRQAFGQIPSPPGGTAWNTARDDGGESPLGLATDMGRASAWLAHVRRLVGTARRRYRGAVRPLSSVRVPHPAADSAVGSAAAGGPGSSRSSSEFRVHCGPRL